MIFRNNLGLFSATKKLTLEELSAHQQAQEDKRNESEKNISNKIKQTVNTVLLSFASKHGDIESEYSALQEEQYNKIMQNESYEQHIAAVRENLIIGGGADPFEDPQLVNDIGELDGIIDDPLSEINESILMNYQVEDVDPNVITNEQKDLELFEEIMHSDSIKEEQSENVILSKKETGFEYLNTPDYKYRHQQSNKDDAANIKVELSKKHKEEKLNSTSIKNQSNNQAPTENVLKRIKGVCKDIYDTILSQFRQNEFLPRENKYVSQLNKILKFILPFKAENLTSKLGFILFIGLWAAFLNNYLSSSELNNSIALFALMLLAGYFIPRFFSFKPKLEKSNKIGIAYEYVTKYLLVHKLEHKNIAILAMMAICVFLAYLFPNLLVSVFCLLVALLCLLLFITSWHLISVIFGFVIMSLFIITPINIVDWDSKLLEIEKVKYIVAHIKTNSILSHTEKVPDVIDVNVDGKYYVETVGQDYIDREQYNNVKDMPIYYLYKISLKPTKTLLLSIKLSQCYENANNENCSMFTNYYEKNKNNVSLNIKPMTFVSEVDNKRIFITSFNDYSVFVRVKLEPVLLDLMKANLTRIKLPLREDDYRFMLPRKLESDLSQQNLLLDIGNPDISLALHYISQLKTK